MREWIELFDFLDRDRDGALSREDLFQGATALGWQGPQAHLYALLDFLTLPGPMSRKTFLDCLEEVHQDPQGVYGRVLRRSTLPRLLEKAAEVLSAKVKSASAEILRDGSEPQSMEALLREVVHSERSGDYAAALQRSAVAEHPVFADETALLLIDPQRAFTAGEWLWRLGPMGEFEAMPLRLAFDNCARLLEVLYQRVEVLFSRCPFAPDGYRWDPALEPIVRDDQPYFLKPSNNLLLPEGNGCRNWLEALEERGIRTLVMGGCTLNSCVRVSAVALARVFSRHRLQVVVDLSLCGARTSNYLNAPQFDGISPVEAGLREMRSAGVIAAGQVSWVEHSNPCSLRSTPTGNDRNTRPNSPDRRERQLKDE